MMEKILNDFIKNLTPGHFEGMLLYVFGSISITRVHFVYAKEWTEGLKGDNKLWEAPEIVVYLFCWLYPHVIMASVFLEMKVETYVWYFMGAILLFSLTGRWGFEWLLAWKGRAPESTTTTKTEIKVEENKKG